MQTTISPIKRFFGLLNGEKEAVKKIYIYSIFYGLVALSLPLGIQAIIGFIQTGQVTASWFVLVLFVCGGIVLAGWLQVLQLKTSERIQQRIFAKSALELAYRIPNIKTEAMYSFYAPELANRFFDTITIQKGLSKILIDFTSAIMQIAFGLILLSFYHPFFIFIGVLTTFMLYIIIAATFKIGLSTSIKESKYKYETAHWLEEIARAVFTFKLSGDSKLHLSKTDEITEHYLEARMNHFSILVKQYWGMIGFKALLALSLLLIGGFLVINQSMNIGQFVAAEIVILLILNSVEKLILSAETIYDVLTAFDKLGVITDLELEKDNKSAVCVEPNEDALGVNIYNLSFHYPGSNKGILKKIDLDVAPGEKLFITGKNASGKASLLNIISTLFLPTEGVVKYNSINRNDLSIKELRCSIASYIGSEELFEASLLENITLNRPGIELKEVMYIIEKLQLNHFLSELQDGLQTELSPKGKTLPQSIVHKILLARCIVVKPQLLLLSNNLSSFSSTDKQLIIDFLTSKENNWTLIATSSDAYLASKCENIALMVKGSIIEKGPTNEMISKEAIKNILYA